MFGLFWFGYTFAVYSLDNFGTYAFVLVGILFYLTLLLTILIPAAAANDALEEARDIVLSLPAWLPQQYKESEKFLLQKYKPKMVFTVWKIYEIKRSLLISSLGTLLTYGFLMGTIGN
ncbi:hypothetical protein AVEN_91833-1 [Araneus ventricosus]|uniref:Uncharacterized protein n=1 Tax=Araneus ventricosus TaxID=182803 RepID=A0A4Y2G4W4_ARAVE|nr:hypothetical protein AVEN_91833-1 [Araneus ventricosus]